MDNENVEGVEGVEGRICNIYIHVIYIYNTSHLAKVIETPYNTYNTFNTPPPQLLLTGVRKKLKKSCRKIWRGWGQGRIFAAQFQRRRSLR